jgi:predicted NBD/HSP70 family sugar kinase
MASDDRTRATPTLLRRLNERLVLDAMWVDNPVSRAELARRVGISKPTASVVLGSLLDAGLVREVGQTNGQPGRNAVLFEPINEAALVYGVDLGARFARVALADLQGTVLARVDVPVVRANLAGVLAAVRQAARELGGTVELAVVGSPGVVDPASGRLRLVSTIDGLEGTPLADLLAEQLGVHVIVENDVKLAALGELHAGHGITTSDFALLWAGTGFGAGIVLDGRLRRGAHGAAGEIEYLPGVPDPSGGAVAALAGGRDAEQVFADARAGNRAALEIVAEVSRRLAYQVAAIASVVDVGLVVLSGGIARSGDLLLGDLRERVAREVTFPPAVELSTLGSSAVVIGAIQVGAREARDRLFIQRTTRERT